MKKLFTIGIILILFGGGVSWYGWEAGEDAFAQANEWAVCQTPSTFGRKVVRFVTFGVIDNYPSHCWDDPSLPKEEAKSALLQIHFGQGSLVIGIALILVAIFRR